MNHAMYTWLFSPRVISALYQMQRVSPCLKRDSLRLGIHLCLKLARWQRRPKGRKNNIRVNISLYIQYVHSALLKIFFRKHLEYSNTLMYIHITRTKCILKVHTVIHSTSCTNEFISIYTCTSHFHNFTNRTQ